MLVSALALAMLMASCQAVNPHFDATKPHHRPGGFQNNYIGFETKGLGDFLRWRWNAVSTGLPPPPQRATPVTAPDLAFLQRNAVAGDAMQPAITWIGHATMLAQFAGLNLVTDPVFSERASPLSFIGPRRAQPPGLRLDQLPRIDVVLISHNHYDHLDEASVLALQAQPGGPPLFVEKYGHPMLRARHLPFAIGESERDQWLSCMHRAMQECGVPELLRAQLQGAFYKTADWMRNQAG